jgi:hypothetical protein
VRTQNVADWRDVSITWDSTNTQCPGWPVTGCTVAIQVDQNQIVNNLNQRVVQYLDITQQCSQYIRSSNTNVQRPTVYDQYGIPVQFDAFGNVINQQQPQQNFNTNVNVFTSRTFYDQSGQVINFDSNGNIVNNNNIFGLNNQNFRNTPVYDA